MVEGGCGLLPALLPCIRAFIHQQLFIDHPLGITEQLDQSKNDQLIFCFYPGPWGNLEPNEVLRPI